MAKRFEATVWTYKLYRGKNSKPSTRKVQYVFTNGHMDGCARCSVDNLRKLAVAKARRCRYGRGTQDVNIGKHITAERNDWTVYPNTGKQEVCELTKASWRAEWPDGFRVGRFIPVQFLLDMVMWGAGGEIPPCLLTSVRCFSSPKFALYNWGQNLPSIQFHIYLGTYQNMTPRDCRQLAFLFAHLLKAR